MADGAHYIVRIARFSDPTELSYLRNKVWREYEILKWMSSLASLPVPRPILCEANSTSPPFMITSKCEGIEVIYGFGTLSEDAKVKIRFFLRLLCSKHHALSKLEVLCASPPPLPAILEVLRLKLDQPLPTEKLRLLCNRNRTTSVANIEPILRRMETVFAEEARRQDGTQLRCIPYHSDAVSHNILIDDSGEIAGVIDWECHVILPAYLAVDYPSWITYDGLQDPNTGQFSPFWAASRQEAASMPQIYSNIVKKLDYDYYLSVKKGESVPLINKRLNTDEDQECEKLGSWLDSQSEAHQPESMEF
ncbi:hypothetical protein J3R30DRAFT_3786936 [Lentinula aciculospora]|uniref:Aminoglycoside phosphotransferase domain-containing protein n=1 Tax=Lentinula aciculospora TaxID=153920 RepID=A0A9W9APR8_9AGAR|nr:hypothetical protein J3R30DRAFT_3786936 [Lentinula aciculospora]